MLLVGEPWGGLGSIRASIQLRSTAHSTRLTHGVLVAVCVSIGSSHKGCEAPGKARFGRVVDSSRWYEAF